MYNRQSWLGIKDQLWVILLKTGPKKVQLFRLNKNLTKTWNFLNYRYVSDVMCLEK